jgi:hypothetical protein
VQVGLLTRVSKWIYAHLPPLPFQLIVQLLSSSYNTVSTVNNRWLSLILPRSFLYSSCPSILIQEHPHLRLLRELHHVNHPMIFPTIKILFLCAYVKKNKIPMDQSMVDGW